MIIDGLGASRAIVGTTPSGRKAPARTSDLVDSAAMNRISDIEIFVAIVADGSFTAAARRLGVSKSHVSRQIQALEDRLGARLLDRTTRTVRPTDAGDAFHARAVRVLEDLAEAERAVRDLQSEPRGTLRLGAPVSFGLRYVAPAVASFMARWPELDVEASYSDRRVDVIGDGFDVVVRIGQLVDSSLIVRRLARTRAHIVASPDYLARRGTPDGPAALAAHACLRYAHQASGRTWMLFGPDGEQTVRIDGPLVADNGDALLIAARAGLGLAYMPDFFICEDIAAGRLVTVLDDWTAHAVPVAALYPHNRHLSAKVRGFIDHLAESLARRPWRDGD